MTPTPITVLLVDDDPGDARLLRAALTSASDHGFTLRRAECLADAVASVADGSIDVVLLDLGLPDSVGLATFEAFHVAAPAVSVVILTDLADDEVALDAVRAGAQDYVVKGSVDELQLARNVRHAAERGRLQAEVARLAEHQRVLAELGRWSAKGPPLDDQLARAAQLTADCLDARLAMVVQHRGDGRCVVRASSGDDALEGELLPTLLASQLPTAEAAEPLLLDDVASLDLPVLEGIPPALRTAQNLLVLSMHGPAWSGAFVLADTPTVHHDDATCVFVRSVGTLLEEAMRRDRAETDLQERAKELAAMASVGRILQEQAPAEQLLVAVAHALVGGMQFAHRAVARIELDGEVVVSDGDRRELVEQISAPLVVNEVQRGEVAVGYRAIRGFLAGYEQQLVDAVAENLSLWLERNDTLQRVRQSEAQLRSVLAQVPGLMWTVGADMRVGWHAGRGHEHISLEPDERKGQHVVDVLGEDHPMVEAVHEALSGRPAVYDSARDGRSFETRVEPLRADDGEVVGAIGMAVDVTEALEAERELNESRRRLEGLFNHAHDAFFLADDLGRYVDANPAAARLTGYSVEQLRGMTIADLAPPDKGVDVDGEFRALRAAGRMSGEWSLLRADGEVIQTRFNAASDVVPGVHLSVMHDVTEQQRAEAALRRSEERFRRLAENAQDVIYRLDVAGRPSFGYVSPAVEELLGMAPSQFYDDVDLPLRMLDDPDDRERVLRYLREPQDEVGPFVGRLRLPDGRRIWIEERHTHVLDDEGRHIATEGVIRDITARKQVEDELREGLEEEQATADDLRTLNEMKDVFLTAVSHELRTPLTSLKGMSHTLLTQHERLDDDQQRLLLERLVHNADRLQSLLDDLLDIDRLTRGASLLNAREVDVAAVAARTLERVPANGHTITSSLAPVHAQVDEAKVERLVENLVVNALRHTDHDARIWVHVEDGGEEVVIRVEDDGPGVPEHLRERIFEPFELGQTPAAQVGGLGIGLNLVARFVELHGGAVCVGEREGGGAAFRVQLPKRAPARDVAEPPVGAEGPHADDMAGMA